MYTCSGRTVKNLSLLNKCIENLHKLTQRHSAATGCSDSVVQIFQEFPESKE